MMTFFGSHLVSLLFWSFIIIGIISVESPDVPAGPKQPLPKDAKPRKSALRQPSQRSAKSVRQLTWDSDVKDSGHSTNAAVRALNEREDWEEASAKKGLIFAEPEEI
ncbi:hypothetical protein DdX_22280 [Ditylenchus destructor]|uniref:Uncharacterized protein n=1 Tax=Ditylenchus destructor TaxID=166010 RepID=A0AAD4MF25_9BILA|nr:hypothetical protein DdX_22280 [Ditylenchus destructor]